MQKGGEFGNKFVFLQTNNINLVKNVAGVSASDDDLRYFEESAGTLPHDKAVTLFYGSIMVNGSWFMVHGNLWFKVNGSGLMIQG